MGIRVESPSFLRIAIVNNSLRAAHPLWVSDSLSESELVAINVFDSTGANGVEIDGVSLPLVGSVRLYNNDLRASSCSLLQAMTSTCVASAAELPAMLTSTPGFSVAVTFTSRRTARSSRWDETRRPRTAGGFQE